METLVLTHHLRCKMPQVSELCLFSHKHQLVQSLISTLWNQGQENVFISYFSLYLIGHLADQVR